MSCLVSQKKTRFRWSSFTHDSQQRTALGIAYACTSVGTVLQDVFRAVVPNHLLGQESGDLLCAPVPVKDFPRRISDIGAEGQQVNKLTEDLRVVEERHQQCYRQK